ncbi:hypothetical protein DJ535_19515 [Citrobacter murliniae]|uniref:Uncharacterized protein n=1 Tax=Citrobacter murliniae TaxID=67829 RepID=A0ABY2PQQ1_9ENTR|nr:hypothetical protein DJ535_19515 [Citrobacter murliniae]
MMSKACQKAIQTLKNKKRFAITWGNKNEGMCRMATNALSGLQVSATCRPDKRSAIRRGKNNQYSFFAQSSQSPLNGRFMFSIASMMSW